MFTSTLNVIDFTPQTEATDRHACIHMQEELWRHSRVHIRRDRLLSCPRCPFVTEFKHHLEYHLRNHVGSKPFRCTRCNYACVSRSMLNSHAKSHTSVCRYRCADCAYASKYRHSLKLHVRKHAHRPATDLLNSDGSTPVSYTHLTLPTNREV